MKVTVSVGGLWHASALVPYLHEQSLLSVFYTSLPSFKLPRHIRRTENMKSYGYLDISQVVARKVFKTDVTLYKADIFDRTVAKNLEPSDIFVVWSSFGVRSISRAKVLGARTVVERGSAHIEEQEKLLREAYELAGIPFSGDIVGRGIIERELAEYESADYISVPSTFVFDSFVRKGINPNKLIKIPYGVDTSLFRQESVNSKFKKDKLKIVFAGAISVRKGIPTLMEAYKLIKSEISVSLYLAGPTSDELDRTVIEDDDVHVLGKLPTSDLISLFQSSHIFVLPSVEEGFARVILEAMACGICPICSTHTGATDVIQSGYNGFLFRPYDAHELATLILYLDSNREVLMNVSQMAAETAKSFTWQTYGERMVEAYRKMMSHD